MYKDKKPWLAVSIPITFFSTLLPLVGHTSHRHSGIRVELLRLNYPMGKNDHQAGLEPYPMLILL